VEFYRHEREVEQSSLSVVVGSFINTEGNGKKISGVGAMQSS